MELYKVRAQRTWQKFLTLIGLTLFLVACGSKDLSQEKSRTSEEMDQLKQRTLTVQTDR